MKRPFKGISLRARITLLTGAVILAVSVALTLASMQNAGARFAAIVAPSAKGDAAQGEMELEFSPGPGLAEGQESATYTVESLEAQDLTIAVKIRTAQAERAFNAWSIVFLILFSAGGMGLAWVLAGRALAPVRRLEEAVSDVSARNLSERLPLPPARDEVGRLTGAFNDMLGRLEEAFEQQKRFSSSVAHELKTPLAAMKMSLQVARLEGQADDELLAVTERGVDRLIGVVGSLLDLTNESVEGLDERFALCPLLREAADDLTPLHHGGGLGLHYDFEDGGISVTGSAALARRLFGNLIENAMKYTAEGGEVSLSARRMPDGDVLVSVGDSGPGIPEEALPHIFEPFYCADPSRSRKLGGAGLGLSIARAVAVRHGWELRAENRPGGGALFTVRIPKG